MYMYVPLLTVNEPDTVTFLCAQTLKHGDGLGIPKSRFKFKLPRDRHGLIPGPADYYPGQSESRSRCINLNQ